VRWRTAPASHPTVTWHTAAKSFEWRTYSTSTRSSECSTCLALWRKHIGFVVDYTTGIATKDKMKADKAVSELVQYTQDFGAFLSSANPNLPKSVVAELVKGQVLTLKSVIDAQMVGDQAKV